MRPRREPPYVPGASWVPLTKRKWALVDSDDYAAVTAVGLWHAHTPSKRRGKPKSRTCYARKVFYVLGKKRSVYLHRWLWERWGRPPTEHIDHIGGNGLDCRYVKLRAATHDQNQRCRPYKNKLGLKGIAQRGSRFVARITVDGQRKTLGRFESAEAAAHAYDIAARALHGAFACPNFEERAA
jgi:hypothetical protein